jgi:predicted alpha/beta hydrolase family esterase
MKATLSSPASLFICTTFIVVSLLFSGCITRPPAHYGTDNTPPTHDDYSLAFVELGEFGSYRERRQIDNAIGLIGKQDRPLLITYIHGWHNDATSGDVDRFKGFLSRLAHSDMVRSHKLNLVGVYLSWPGESFRVPVLSTFTFWDRKRTAERVASNTDCLDSILELSRAARKREKNYTILLGHSFGGLILERTVAHTVQTLQGQQQVKPPWDLALILNPASDAVLARQMVVSLDQLNAGKKIDENLPIVVELASANDQATGVTFPIGSSLGALIGAHWAWNKVEIPGHHDKPRGPISERGFYLSTPGNNPYLINYAIEEDGHIGQIGVSDAFDANLRTNRDGRYFYTSAPRNAQSAAQAAKAGNVSPPSSTNNWRKWQIRVAGDLDPKYAGNARVPFWIIKVPTDIIDNHGGIWSDNSMALMAAIFRLRFPIGSGSENVAPGKTGVLPKTAPNLPAKTYPRQIKG